MKKKRIIKYGITIIEVLLLAFVIYWSFSNGFTTTLNESFGLSNDEKVLSTHLFGNINVKNAMISILIIIIFFSFVFYKNKIKNKKR